MPTTMRCTFRSLVLVLAILVIVAILPSGSAHNATPVDSRTGDFTLGPQGYFHRFGFQMNKGDLLHIEYTVTNPQGQAVSFSLHRHKANATEQILNMTQTSDLQEMRVPGAGFYMPQWRTLVSTNLTLHYNLAYYLGPTTLDLVYGISGMVIPSASWVHSPGSSSVESSRRTSRTKGSKAWRGNFWFGVPGQGISPGLASLGGRH